MRPESFYNSKRKQTREERKDSPLLAIRLFNNRIKSELISNTARSITNGANGISVLDLCGGTGGDLTKFQHVTNIRRVVLVDISQDSVDEARKRYEELAKRRRNIYNATFLRGNAFDLEEMIRLVGSDEKFDLINCQFAFHYACSSQESMNNAFQVLAYFLKPGGKFVATVPDADFILNNLDHVPNVPTVDIIGRSLIRDPYIIRFTSANEYLFTMGDAVVNVPEYLVLRSSVDDAAKMCGLAISRWVSFVDLHDHMTNRNGSVVECTVQEKECARLYVAFEVEKL